MSWYNKKGLNFRSTAGFVTDGANEDGVTGGIATYPTSMTIDGDTFDVGWGTPGNIQPRDRDSGLDPRLAGLHFIANADAVTALFRVDLPAPGVYELTLASGDPNSATVAPYWQIRDDATVLETVDLTSAPIAQGRFYDINQTLHTTAANWVANQTPKQYTFASSILRIGLGPSAGGSNNSMLNHLGIRAVPPSGPIYAPYRRRR